MSIKRSATARLFGRRRLRYDQQRGKGVMQKAYETVIGRRPNWFRIARPMRPLPSGRNRAVTTKGTDYAWQS